MAEQITEEIKEAKNGEEFYVDLYGMIDLEGITKEDEESGDLIRFMDTNKVYISKVKGMGFGDHRFTCLNKEVLLTLKDVWYPDGV